MDNVTDAPKVAATHGKNALAKVPKPVLIAGGVGIVGFIWYKKKHNAAVINASGSANATPVADQGATNQSYTGAGDVTGSIASPYAGYGNVGNYNTGLPVSTTTPDGSGATGASEVGNLTALLGTLFPNGAPLGQSAQPTPVQDTANLITALASGGFLTAPAPQAAPAQGVMTVAPPAYVATPVSTPKAPAPVAHTCPPSFPLGSARGCYKSVKGSTGHYNHIYQDGTVIGGNSR